MKGVSVEVLQVPEMQREMWSRAWGSYLVLPFHLTHWHSRLTLRHPLVAVKCPLWLNAVRIFDGITKSPAVTSADLDG